MAYIYKITNDINGKIYIGKTNYSLKRRFQQHCNDATKNRCQHRPLYRAMNKYGKEHFHIELLEETDNPETREIFWISQYNAYHNGYNATYGGDGKSYLDYDAIAKTYSETGDITTTARIHNVSSDSVRNIAHNYGLEIKQSWEVLREKKRKAVSMHDVYTSTLIQTFESLKDAAQYLLDNNLVKAKKANDITSHIAGVCMGKRKTAYGYTWKYIEK